MRKIVVLVFVFVQVLVSCSGSDDSSVETAYLVKKAVADGITLEYHYTSGTNKMSNFTASNVLQTFEYTGDLVTRSLRYLYNNPTADYQIDYEYDSNQKLVAETFTDLNAMTADRKVYTYNSDGTVSYQAFSGDVGNLTSNGRTGVLYRNENGETYKVEEFLNGSLILKQNFTFDNQNSIFKNVAGFDKLISMYDNGKKNNILSSNKYDGNGTLLTGYVNAYSYNSGGFPDEMSTTLNTGSISTTNYFYR